MQIEPTGVDHRPTPVFAPATHERTKRTFGHAGRSPRSAVWLEASRQKWVRAMDAFIRRETAGAQGNPYTEELGGRSNRPSHPEILIRFILPQLSWLSETSRCSRASPAPKIDFIMRCSRDSRVPAFRMRLENPWGDTNLGNG